MMKCLLQKIFRNKSVSVTEDLTLKYLIIGLGNVGEEYHNTKHNIGFDVLDSLAQKEGCEFKSDQLGSIAQFKYKGRTIYLLKPSTYVNLSGKAVRYWVQKLKIAESHWLVVADELQFDIGTFKLQKKGSDGGHNGLRNIQDTMQTINYPRLRIGIGNNFYPGKQVDYVLSRWDSDHRKHMENVIIKASEAIKSFVTIGIDRTMSQFNSKKKQTPSTKSESDYSSGSVNDG